MLNVVSSILSYFSRRKSSESPAHLRSGLWGEEMAERYLIKKHYKIIGRRVKVGKRDELDLVTRSPGDVLVFVEVKTRADERFGRPFCAVNRRKRKNLSRAALRYMMRLKSKPDYFRLDVIEVIGTAELNSPVVRHIENAFPLSGNKRVPW